MKYATTDKIAALITNFTDIGSFQTEMQHPDRGVHTTGHYTVGADPAGDYYTSPGGMFSALTYHCLDAN